MRVILVILFFLCCLTKVFADQLIIEPEMGRAPIVNAMSQAQHSVKLVMYGFTDDQLLNALLSAQAKQKSVQVILEQNPYRSSGENARAIQAFNQHGLSWEGAATNFKLVHQKTLIIDDTHAIVMTFNFTRSTFNRERNFALVIDAPKTVKAIERVFSADWNHLPITTDAMPELIYSPDHSRKKFIRLIRECKRSIRIYAQDINDYQVIGALAKAARKGIEVTILTSGNIHGKKAGYLSRAGVKLSQSSDLYIHAKVILLDDNKAIIGSTNLTAPSFDENRELSIVTTDMTVIKQLQKTFKQDLRNSK